MNTNTPKTKYNKPECSSGFSHFVSSSNYTTTTPRKIIVSGSKNVVFVSNYNTLIEDGLTKDEEKSVYKDSLNFKGLKELKKVAVR